VPAKLSACQKHQNDHIVSKRLHFTILKNSNQETRCKYDSTRVTVVAYMSRAKEYYTYCKAVKPKILLKIKYSFNIIYIHRPKKERSQSKYMNYEVNVYHV
jgi:hypothetical protein